MTATIYFAGGEDIDFVNDGGTFTVSTSSSNFRSSYARCALNCQTNTSSYARAVGALNDSTGLSSWWFSARVICTDTNSGSDVIFFGDTTQHRALGLRSVAGNVLALVKRDNSGTVTTLATSAGTLGSSVQKLDIQVSSYGVSGTVNVWINNVPFLTYTGDLTTNSRTVLTELSLGSANVNSACLWSEIVISDEDTRGISLCTLAPAGAGNADTFDGFTGASALASIDKTTSNDSTYIFSATAAQIEQFTTGALPAGNFNVLGVRVSARAAAGAGGPQNMDLGFRSSGTDHWSGDILLNPGFANYGAIFQSSPWPASGLGTGFNIGVKSVT